MTYETIVYDVSEGVATLTLNRPEMLNAFNTQMVEETTKALKSAARDAAVRCILLTGNGRGFSSGQDLGEAAQLAQSSANLSTGDHLRHHYHLLIRQIFSTEKPVIGVINGVAVGIGMSLALATDIRLASDKAVFSLGFSKIGMIPDGGANWLLTRMIGYPRAYELAVTSAKITAAQAQAWGMINEVYPHDQLLENAAAYGRKLAQGATLAFGLTKRAMLRGLTQTLEENLDYEAHLQEIAGKSNDCQEGITAFLEKRQPNFKGQ